MDAYKKYSKHLSYVLRHRPDVIGITLDAQGWVNVDELIARSDKGLSRDIIEAVVLENDKKRFILNEDKTRIRANQGHSVKVDLGLEAKNSPSTLYHGTATRFLDLILQDGLKKMNRHHVHLSSNLDTASKVGSRHGKLAVLSIDAKMMQDAGYTFYCSENGVWLTETVPPQYISIL